MKKMKWLVSAALASAMLMVTAGNVYAAKYDDPITGVEIELDYDLATGLTKDDIKVDCGTSRTLNPITVRNLCSGWCWKQTTIRCC